MNTREAMDGELKRVVVPVLRQHGFTGSFPHFRRIRSDVDLLTFQFDRNGGGFVVEVAVGPIDGITTHWGKCVPAAKLTAWDMHPGQRRRLKPNDHSDINSWFRFDMDKSCESVAREALACILHEFSAS